MKSLIIASVMAFVINTSVMASCQDFASLECGVALITTKTDSNDKYEVTGVLFANFDGFAMDLDDKAIDLVETSLELSVDGKNVKVYTNVGTYNVDGLDWLDELSLTGLSLNYDKVDDFSIQNKKKLSIVSGSAVKYVDLGVIQLDMIAGASFGGVTKARVKVMDDKDDSGIEFENSDSDKHYGTLDFSIGTDIVIVDDINLYGYVGVSKQFGENTEERGVSAGAVIYGSEIAEGIDQEFIFGYDKKTIHYKDALKTIKDSRVWFMYRVTF